MGLKTWFRRRFIVPRAGAMIDKRLGLKKGTVMGFLKGYATLIGAIGGLLVAIAAFTQGSISVTELLAAISAVIAALGLRRAIANK
jgi:hypothetical protein